MEQDLHLLPKLRDSLSYVFIEHAVIDRKDAAIEFINQDGRVHIPVASLCVLMLGPGTSITHAAIKALAENGCTVVWTGEDGIRLYAQGIGETRKAYHLLRQAELASNPTQHAQVVRRMYQKRFNETIDTGLSLSQVRGLEGVRVRRAYSQASKTYGIAWQGRRYDRGTWGKADPINRALSAANALLNGICHAAIVSGGYSPGIGFVHSGRQLSFIYDIADLYKTELSIPLAFEITAESEQHVESRVRQASREKFREARLLERILPDIDELLGVQPEPDGERITDQNAPEPLWAPLLAEEVDVWS